MPITRPEPQNARVIAHVDMDCFYVQVEQRRNPDLQGLPTAVVQYNSWKGGGLIAVGYEARKFGVKRSMRGDEAKEVCPNIQLVQVPVARGKADLTVYRNAGSEVVSILATKGRCERASIDEVYIDLTDAAELMLSENPPDVLEVLNEEALKSHVLGLNFNDSEREKSVKEWFSRSDAGHEDKLLACGAIIVAQLRVDVLKKTTFTCSAGIAHNKMLAKLASAMHKPAQQTIVPSSSIKDLLANFPVKKMMLITRPEPQNARVIAHVDMDCFYVQVEQRRNPDLQGLPTAVVQYNSWKGGGLIAVGYEARKFGVKRSMRGDEAKEVCPNIQLVQVPVARGKADLTVYRNAGSEVVSILATKGRCERASIDEVYIDLTDAAELMLSENPPDVLEVLNEEALKSHVLGLNFNDSEREKSVKEWFSRSDAGHEDKLLACGAIIVAQLRVDVLKKTTFTCSAGIAHNKMLAKLASAMHKPAQQTIVPSSSIKDLLANFPVKKMKQLGGKLGSSIQIDLRVNNVGDLLQFSKERLQEHYGINTGTWLWNIARGINGDEVVDRLLPKSHGCGKTFPGPQALRTVASVKKWLNQLCEELSERIKSDLDQNKRVAHTLTLHASSFKVNDVETRGKFPSKSCPLRYGTSKLQEDAIKLFDCALREYLDTQNIGWGITALSVTASKIIDIPHGTSSILTYFEEKNPSFISPNSCDEFSQENVPLSSAGNNECQITSEVVKRDVHTSDCKKGHSESKTLHEASSSAKRTKNVGTCSILRYFQGSGSSSLVTTNDQMSLSLVSGSGKHPGGNQIEQSDCSKLFSETSNNNQSQNQHHPWVLNVEDIDPSVLDELPEEIQREVRGWFHLSKRANTSRKRSSINNYFLPVKR